MRNPRDFFKPLAIDAPEPIRDIPFKPSRMIHFLDFSNEKMVAKVPDIAPTVDILLGNLEDAVPIDRKEAARAGLIKVGREMELGDTALWTRVNELASPYFLDDLTQIVGEIGSKIEVVMIPKVEGPWDIHYVDRLLAQLEAKAELDRPILIHAILETAQGVANLEEIACASPRIQGMSFGPADLAASRRMKTTRVGGGHPGYRTIADPDPENPDAPRPSYQQDPWHYSIARMVDACTSVGALPFYGPYGDIRDEEGCETQFRASFLLGCVGAWSLHPAQIAIAKRVYSPDPDEVAFAKKVIEAIPDGRGVHMIDGKMQDDATWKQCKVMVNLAEMLAKKDPELAEAYGFEPGRRSLRCGPRERSPWSERSRAAALDGRRRGAAAGRTKSLTAGAGVVLAHRLLLAEHRTGSRQQLRGRAPAHPAGRQRPSMNSPSPRTGCERAASKTSLRRPSARRRPIWKATANPAVLLHLYTGGDHCCSISRSTPTTRPRPPTRRIEHDFFDAGVTVADLRGDRRLELQSADDRFAYRFSSLRLLGAARADLQAPRQAHSVDVTRQFPATVAADAHEQLAPLPRLSPPGTRPGLSRRLGRR